MTYEPKMELGAGDVLSDCDIGKAYCEMLVWMVKVNVVTMRQSPFPPIRDAGVRLAKYAYEDATLNDVTTCMSRRSVTPSDAVCWRAAELLHAGKSCVVVCKKTDGGWLLGVEVEGVLETPTFIVSG